MEVVKRRRQRSHKAIKRDMSSSSDSEEVVHVPAQKKVEKCSKKEIKSVSLEKKATQIKETKMNSNRADSESHIDQQQEPQTQLGRPKRVRKITEKAEQELKYKQKKAKQSKSQKDQQNEDANKTLLGDSAAQKQQERISSRLRGRLMKMANEGYAEEDDDDNKDNDESEEQTSQFNAEEEYDSSSNREINEKKDEEKIVRKQKNIQNKKHKKQVKHEEDETDEECQHQENNQHNRLEFNDNRQIDNCNKENDSVVEIEIQQIEVEELTVKVENEKLDIEGVKETNQHTICKEESCAHDLKQEEGNISEKDKYSEKQTQNTTFSLPKIEEIEKPLPIQEESQANEENQLQVKKSSGAKPIKQKSQKTKKQAKNIASNRKSCTLDDQAAIEEEKQLQGQQNDEDDQEYDQFDEGISPREILDNQDNNTQTITFGKARKMPWSEEEDKLVIRLVEEHGPMKWTFIAQHIPGRIGKQCRERWHNHLNPKIKKSAWSDEEEWLLFLCHRLKGNRWAEITSCMAGRTDNAIKNHWNSSMKKRLPQFFQRYNLLRKGQPVEYSISELYQELEKSFLSQLLALPDDGSDELYQKQVLQDSKFQQQPLVSSNLSSNKTNKLSDQSSQNQETQRATQKIKEKQSQKLAKHIEHSPSLPSAAARTESNFKKQSEHTPATNNNNRNSYYSSEQQQPNTADCSGDVKEIIQRIPQSPVQFDEFKKQILLLSSKDESHQFSSLHLKELSPRDNAKQDQQQSPSVDISWSDTKNLERILSTPMQVQNYLENNPQFADIIRAALNYPKISQFNTNTTAPEEKKIQKKQNKQKQKFAGSEMLQSEDSKGCFDGLEKSLEQEENNDELQVIEDKKNTILSQKQTKQIEKKEKVTKKRVKHQPIIVQEEEEDYIGDISSKQQLISHKRSKAAKQKDSNQEVKPSTKQSKKSQKQKILSQGSVPYLHPLYVMEHPYYDLHSVEYTEYPNPMPVSLNQSEKNHPLANPSSSQQKQNHKTKRTSHHLQQQQLLSSSNQPMHFHSKLQETQDDTYQTPMKYQKNNSSKRNILKHSNLVFKQQFQSSPRRDSDKDKLSNSRHIDKSNHLMYNISDELNFSDNELNHQHTNPFDGQNSNPNSFMKENIHPNRSSMRQSSNKNNSSHHRMNSSSYHHNHNHNEGSNNLQYFTTPNKYETPSKLLDFDSDVHLNVGGSVDHYFNMGVFSSHKKINRSQHSAFKCFPNTPNNHNIHKSPF